MARLDALPWYVNPSNTYQINLIQYYSIGRRSNGYIGTLGCFALYRAASLLFSKLGSFRNISAGALLPVALASTVSANGSCETYGSLAIASVV